MKPCKYGGEDGYGLYMEEVLKDLLCVIHRDGGHYLEQYRLDKTYDDGIDKVLEAYHRIDQEF